MGINQKQIRKLYHATIADLEYQTGDDGIISFCQESNQFFSYISNYDVEPDGITILNTGDGGTSRWVIINDISFLEDVINTNYQLLEIAILSGDQSLEDVINTNYQLLETAILSGDQSLETAIITKVNNHYHDKLYTPNGENSFVYTDDGKNLHIDGNILQKGTIYETHVEQIYTTKNYIILRSGATGGMSIGEYTGFEAYLYDGVNSGRLVFDSDGTARVGDVSSEQPLTTRIENPNDEYFAYWDSDNTRLDFKQIEIDDINSLNDNLTSIEKSIYWESETTKTIYYNGDVGINIDKPQYDLHVSGITSSKQYLVEEKYTVKDVRGMYIPQRLWGDRLDTLNINYDMIEKVSGVTFLTNPSSIISTTTLTNGNVLIGYSYLNDGRVILVDQNGNYKLSNDVFFQGDGIKSISTTTLINGNVLIGFIINEAGLFTIVDQDGYIVKSVTSFSEDEPKRSISTTTLTNGNVLIGYCDFYKSSYHGMFIIIDQNGNIVKSATIFNEGETTSISTTTLTNGNVLIGYCDFDKSSYHGMFIIIDQNGNIVKSATIFNEGETTSISTTTLTNGNVLIGYNSIIIDEDFLSFIIYEQYIKQCQCDHNLHPIISIGLGSPATVPNKIGDLYFDTDGSFYIAFGTNSDSDWVRFVSN